MGLWEIIGAAGGLIGAVAGLLAYLKSGEANRHSIRANEIAVETKGVAEHANRHSETANSLANQANIHADTANQLARESNAIARSMLTKQEQAEFDSRRAKVEHRFSDPNAVLARMRSGDGGFLTMWLYNEGPAIARDVRIEMTFPTESPHYSETIREFAPNKNMSPNVAIARSSFPSAIDMTVGITVSWKDGNGSQQFKTGVHIQGDWMSDWKMTTAPYPEDNLRTER